MLERKDVQSELGVLVKVGKHSLLYREVRSFQGVRGTALALLVLTSYSERLNCNSITHGHQTYVQNVCGLISEHSWRCRQWYGGVRCLNVWSFTKQPISIRGERE